MARLRNVASSGLTEGFSAAAIGNADRRFAVRVEPAPAEPGHLLVTLGDDDDAAFGALPASSVAQLVRTSTRFIVFVSPEGRILWANEAFLEAIGASRAVDAAGSFLEDCLELPGGAPLSGLFDRAAHSGRIAAERARLVARSGETRDVDLDLTCLPASGPRGYGVVLSPADGTAAPRDMPEAERLANMVGVAPLKELVRDSSDVLEKMCIESALRLCGNTRTKAAEALGLSRQSLYAKLERYGLGGR
jgi:PAS domain-containing protein